MSMPYRILFGLLVVCLVKCIFRKDVRLSDFDYDATVPIRGLLAFFVVCGHCDNMNRGSVLLNMLHLSTPAVAVFFFMSGFGYMKRFQDKGRLYLDRLIIPSGIKLLVPLGMAYALWQVLEFFLNLRVNEFPMPPHSWYVYALIILTLLFVLWMKLSEKVALVGLIASSLLWYFVGFLFVHNHDVWWHTIPAFVFGVLWAKYEDLILKFVKRNVLVATVEIIGAVFLVYCLYVLVPGEILFLRDIRLWLIGPVVAYIVYILGPIRSRILGFLGGISYEIYLLHCIPEFGLSTAFSRPEVYLTVTFLFASTLGWIIKNVNQSLISFFKRKFCDV